ncbi:FAD-dependent monooxygenase atmM [Colletotrichum shisoi]|uniref:FAD-dependent monooxygenase atmM n=1 Tax=Colletotrichum shisoi TaxID=2078593 RepID=A0A5Q4BT75_9PEZI|nr:FAD-dependent monooxygenase atmM [Colletotrichum shisoi]
MGPGAIIVEDSVTGLSPASMLEQLGIDYMLLKAHETIVPQPSASIGLIPNGLRILDQIGCYETIRDNADDFYNHTNLRGADGRPLIKRQSTSLSERLEEKTGYPCIFVDRQFFLQVLHNNIKDEDKIPAGERVTGVEVPAVGVQVQTQDGCTYVGDYLIGADGVYTIIRKEMWQLADQTSPGIFSLDEESSGLPGEALEAAVVVVCKRQYGHARDVVKQGEQMQSLTGLKNPFVGLRIRYLVPLFDDVLLLNSFPKTSLANIRIDKMDLANVVQFNDEKCSTSLHAARGRKDLNSLC